MNEQVTYREFKEANEAHETLDNQRFRDVAESILILRRDLLDENYGILPELKKQVVKTNGKVMLHQKVLWFGAGLLAFSAFSGNAALLHIITSL